MREELINSVWTHDGKIIIKLHSDKKVTVTSEDELQQLLLELGCESVPVTSTPAF